ncbi:MAG: PQQ-like beta-propeller repeat protein [Euryarchaeota archaeon]|nr:PQQ-like beta-propeller repeat protein [Euryarchaeota archaeon]
MSSMRRTPVFFLACLMTAGFVSAAPAVADPLDDLACSLGPVGGAACAEWLMRHPGAGLDELLPVSLLSADGSVLYQGSGDHFGGCTLAAVDTSAGLLAWSTGLGGVDDCVWLLDLTESPDGATVYATGLVDGAHNDQAVIFAVDADDGSLIWSGTHGTANGFSIAIGAAVSTDGARLYLAGATATAPDDDAVDGLVVALDATDGTLLWDAVYAHPAGSFDLFLDIAVSADGTTVYAGGSATDVHDTTSGDNEMAYAAAAYDALTGTELWNTTGGATDADFGRRLAVTPDGDSVLVGGNKGVSAFSSADGSSLWDTIVPGASDWDDLALFVDLALSPDATTAYLATTRETAYYDAVLAAFDTSSGLLEWTASEGTPNEDTLATGVAVSPDGTSVYLASTGLRGGSTYVPFLGWVGLPGGSEATVTVHDVATGVSSRTVSYTDPLAEYTVATDVHADGSAFYMAGVVTVESDQGDFIAAKFTA